MPIYPVETNVDPGAHILFRSGGSDNTTRFAPLAAFKPPAAYVLRPWFAKLANRNAARANVVCIGDSVTEGHGATTIPNRWLARAAAVLQSRYPSTGLVTQGRGYLPTAYTGQTTFSNPYTRTGGSADVSTAAKRGPKQSVNSMTAGGQKVDFALVGTSADIMWVGGPSTGTFNWSVDGGATTPIATVLGSILDGNLTRVSLGAAGAHTLTVAWASGGTVFLDGVIEYNGDENTGIQFHDAGHFGWSSADWTTVLTPTEWPSAIAALNPGLIIIELGLNDILNNVPPATFQQNIQNIISVVRGRLTAPYPPIILLQTAGRAALFSNVWSQYVAAAQAIAASDPQVVVLDITQQIPIFGSPNDYGAYLNDPHFNNLGNAMIGDIVAGFIAPY